MYPATAPWKRTLTKRWRDELGRPLGSPEGVLHQVSSLASDRSVPREPSAQARTPLLVSELHFGCGEGMEGGASRGGRGLQGAPAS
jgi:hypothetical protein